MNKEQKKRILIFICLSLIDIVSPNIILKFKTLKGENITKENLMEKLYYNNIYFEIKIGTPGSISKFNYLNSSSFNYLENVIFKYY